MFAFTPPFVPMADVSMSLESEGFALLSPEDFSSVTQHSLNEWDSLQAHWENLPSDDYLKDGGHYRRRRHASIIIRNKHIESVKERPHWQPVSYNALHGGIDRWFAPCESAFLDNEAFKALVLELGGLFCNVKNIDPNTNPWFVEVHQFRIDTKEGIGRPTPEGAHRDGVDFVAVLLVDRHHIKGGETRIFSANGPQGQRFTLTRPWTLVLLDDVKVIHETTPIQPESNNLDDAWRDTLVLTYRLKNFQDKNP